MMESRYALMIKKVGMEIVKQEKLNDMMIYTAQIETNRGALMIYCGENGTARIDKPNGTHKWYYEKSPAQIGAAIRKTLEFYK